MADGDLQGVLAGGGPLGPLELMGGIAAQQAVRPENYSAGPVGQAMGMWGQTLAQGRAMDYAQQLAQAQTGAMGDMGKYLSAPDPIAAAAADTGGNPAARWMMLRTTPEQLAQMRLQTAQTGLTAARTPGEAARSRLLQAGASEYLGGGAGAGAVLGAAPTGAGPPAAAAPPGAPGALSPQAQQVLAMPPGPDKVAALRALPPAVQRLILGRIRRPTGTATPAPAVSPSAAAPTPAPAASGISTPMVSI